MAQPKKGANLKKVGHPKKVVKARKPSAKTIVKRVKKEAEPPKVKKTAAKTTLALPKERRIQTAEGLRRKMVMKRSKKS